MKKKLSISILAILLVGVLAFGAVAYFSDMETSNNNTFAAGTLDLTIDGQNTNAAKFNVSNMRPDSQPTTAWTLKNVGSLPGYLDIENISVFDDENGLLDPEVEANDNTPNSGELSQLINLRLYIDYDKAGGYSTGDYMIYNGKLGNVPSHFELNEAMAANAELRIVAVVDWWESGSVDNQGQSDKATLNLSFELAQRTSN